jgi:transcriptional regulator with XRE-family HTH domain
VGDWEAGAKRLVGVRLRQLRESAGWTQQQLSEAADLDRSYVADIERGVRNPGMTSLVKLADALDCGIAALFPREVLDLRAARDR